MRDGNVAKQPLPAAQYNRDEDTAMEHEQPPQFQDAAANEGPSTFSGLTSLWIEIPPFCHLRCSYCYTGADRNMQAEPEGMLSLREYKDIINEFADLGGSEVGIPGRGEPFHPRNEQLVRELIDTAYARGVTTMLFTTGETLLYAKEGKKETPYVRRDNDDLIRFLIDRKVLLFVKYNSRKPEVQDKLVDMEGYTVRRNEALAALISKYRLPEKKKLGVATSYMDANENEIVEIYEFAKANGLVFDCDTVLAQGRGEQYVRNSTITEEKYVALCKEFRRREKVDIHPGGTYITSSCDRIRRHLYIDFRGDGYPCLGAWRKIPLGNVRNMSLRAMWDTPLRQQLRNERRSVFKGVCARCDNFFAEECHSCLSRSVEKVHIDRRGEKLELMTRGCINHRPNAALWRSAVRDYLGAALARPELPRRFRERFAYLWDGEETGDGSAGAAEVDVRFPMNAIWRFVSTHDDRQPAPENPGAFPGGVLAKVTVPSVRILFNRHPEERRMFLAIHFYDRRNDARFMRAFANQAGFADLPDMIRVQQWADHAGIAGREMQAPGLLAGSPVSGVQELWISPEGSIRAAPDNARERWDITPFMRMPLVRETVRRMKGLREADGRAAGEPVPFAALDEAVRAAPGDTGDAEQQFARAHEDFLRMHALSGQGPSPLRPALSSCLEFFAWAGYMHYAFAMNRCWIAQLPGEGSHDVACRLVAWTDDALEESEKELARALFAAIIEPFQGEKNPEK